MTSTLYLCYLGIEEPLVQTQVIAYLAGLAQAGIRVHLLTFDGRGMVRHAAYECRTALKSQGIEWHTLRYHKRPAIPSTLFDICAGVAFGARLIQRERIEVVHARAHVPAVMGAALKRLYGTSLLFDIRGLLPDEYADAGLWKTKGLFHRAGRDVERWLLSRADAAVVLTRRAQQWLFESDAVPPQLPVQVIPCCVDTRRFAPHPARVADLRARLRLGAGPVMVYAGKFGGWYMAAEMVEFFEAARKEFLGLRFLILTQSDPALIEMELARRGIGSNHYCCLRASPEDLPAYISIGDFAVSFRKPAFSQLAASPTKIGEYLAAGLPIVYNSGIGDLRDLAEERIGVELSKFCYDAYVDAARRLRPFIKEKVVTARRCREAAERHFSLRGIGIPRYRELYGVLADRVHLSRVGSHAASPPPAASVVRERRARRGV